MIDYESLIRQRRSIRLPGYDYTQPGYYFITICSAGRQCIFGEITVKEECLAVSPIGKLIIECWESIPFHFPNVALDAFVLMPNHLHGILQIEDRRDHGTKHFLVSVKPEAFGKPVTQSIPTIIRSFKSIVSRQVIDEGLGNCSPVGQRNSHEHVIRPERDLDEIRKYISENPSNWSQDPENQATMERFSSP